MAPLNKWEHLSTPDQIRQRSKALTSERIDMISSLVDVRKSRGMTQNDVAEVLGMSQQSVSKIESYDANPRLDTLQTYANAIGATIEIHVKEDDVTHNHFSDTAQQWEKSDQLPKSTVVSSRDVSSSIRHMSDWSESVAAPDSMRVDFALGA